ncbi:hypothetical protein B0A48_08419 [Cryoendolithus antarcticus]|uniref:HTH APSES-type domain-containing protein n=1 Tax=Cryoendolithus antarcticus TaxID=1507870 RepID=A0A1V8T636_9PEZI|nr:hypothetical protein B0A48_08419 [Cryoendolithus antarcticus]
MTDKVYSATYSNVPVYECNIDGNHVMRRRADDWINATHILKVAEYDKPSRTRILEREVQKGVHEKVQGGYGKYQGTWIPLAEGRLLAERNGVLEKMKPIFDYVPGDKTPPPAPKHATAASGKPRSARQPAQQRKPAIPTYAAIDARYEQNDPHMHERATTPSNETVASESVFDGYDTHPYGSSRKRRRIADDPQAQADTQHQLWADELLDYYVLLGTSPETAQSPPQPPEGADLDRPIDDQGHTALHWGAAMGDIDMVKKLIRDNAQIDVQSRAGETPLMRSVKFSNVYENMNMERLSALLIKTVSMQDWSGCNVFHHIANTTTSKKKYQCARYYMDCVLNNMQEVLSPDQVERVLNEQDNQGDTAITIAARNGARKCVRSLIGRNAAVDIPNGIGETADQLIVALNHRRQERTRQMSSSPFQSAELPGSTRGPSRYGDMPFDPLNPDHGADGSNDTDNAVFKSEPALNLTASIMPSLFAKARELAMKFDNELAEKDPELAEAQRVVDMRRAELEQLRRQADNLRIQELEQTAGGAQTDEQLIAQLETLEAECLSIVEEEQKQGLAAQLATPAPSDRAMSPTRNFTPEQMLETQISYARQVIELANQRKELVKVVVKSISLAGENDGRIRDYKRLVTNALGVGEDEVEGLLPEIVAELEQARGMEVST